MTHALYLTGAVIFLADISFLLLGWVAGFFVVVPTFWVELDDASLVVHVLHAPGVVVGALALLVTLSPQHLDAPEQHAHGQQ
jgi:hypothetical protein